MVAGVGAVVDADAAASTANVDTVIKALWLADRENPGCKCLICSICTN